MHTYRGRRAASIENDDLRVTVLEGGGHIAEIYDKRTGVNPLWTPAWPSIEPASYDPARHSLYGAGAEARLLAAIMGHNVCLDIFGMPTADEEAQGMTAHGEASVATYEIEHDRHTLTMRTMLPLAQARFERQLELSGRRVRIHETVESHCAFDRPIGWTQHVTIGPPFLEKGVTELRSSATRSKVLESPFGADDYLEADTTFDWPIAPRAAGGTVDLQQMSAAPRSSAFTTHLMDPAQDRAYFVAYSPKARLAFGYAWKRSDFPWLGIWEENFSRLHAPWGGRSLTRGMEFGVSPFPESRRRMVDRGTLFNVPTFRWLPARATLEAEYWAATAETPNFEF
jgi:hypothetical protein